MKIICISDTHGEHGKLRIPSGDILIHAGDFTNHGTIQEITSFNSWWASQPHKYKIVVPGNHDLMFEESPQQAVGLLSSATAVLIHEELDIEGIKIFGSPHTPMFCDWSFMYEKNEAARIWNNIPDEIDILITHGPAYGVLDRTNRGVCAGCPVLLNRIREIKPAVHIFGHIHEAFGRFDHEDTVHINAASIHNPFQTFDYGK